MPHAAARRSAAPCASGWLAAAPGTQCLGLRTRHALVPDTSVVCAWRPSAGTLCVVRGAPPPKNLRAHAAPPLCFSRLRPRIHLPAHTQPRPHTHTHPHALHHGRLHLHSGWHPCHCARPRGSDHARALQRRRPRCAGPPCPQGEHLVVWEGCGRVSNGGSPPRMARSWLHHTATRSSRQHLACSTDAGPGFHCLGGGRDDDPTTRARACRDALAPPTLRPSPPHARRPSLLSLTLTPSR